MSLFAEFLVEFLADFNKVFFAVHRKPYEASVFFKMDVRHFRLLKKLLRNEVENALVADAYCDDVIFVLCPFKAFLHLLRSAPVSFFGAFVILKVSLFNKSINISQIKTNIKDFGNLLTN